MAIVGSTMMIAFWSIVLPGAIWVLIKLFGELFYGIGVMLFQVMDLLQSTFRKLAGLGTVYFDSNSSGFGGGAGGESGDIVSLVLTSDAIIDVLLSVSVFALGLVIVASIVQMVRLEYTSEGSKNSKEKIFTNALKSLLMFVLIPIVSLVGIRISNYLLQAVDYATSGSGASTVSGSVFKASCASASKVTNPDYFTNGINLTNLVSGIFSNVWDNNPVVQTANGKVEIKGFGDVFYVSGSAVNEQSRARLAQKVDEAFVAAKQDAETGLFSVGTELKEGQGTGTSILGKYLSYNNLSAVEYFYNTSNINYLILYLGCYLCIKALFHASLGCITRIYKIAALFVVAPATIGLQPIDNGTAFGKWKSSFIKNVLSCYGIIVSLNLYFTIVGILSRVSLWDGWAMRTPNLFVQFLFVITGATMLKTLSGEIAGFVGGGGDVMSDGEGAAGSIGKMAGSVMKVGGMAMNAGAGLAGKLGASFARNNKVTLADGTKTTARKENKKIDDYNKAKADFDDKYMVQKDADGNEKFFDKTSGKELSGDALTKAKKASTNLQSKETAKKEAEQRFKDNDNLSKQSEKAARRDLNAGMKINRFSEAFKSSGLASSWKNITGNAGEVMFGKAYKGMDEAFMADAGKKMGEARVKALGGDKMVGTSGLGRGVNAFEKKGITAAEKASIDMLGSEINTQDKAQKSEKRKAIIDSMNNYTEAYNELDKKQTKMKNDDGLTNIDEVSGYQYYTNSEIKAYKDLVQGTRDFSSGLINDNDLTLLTEAFKSALGGDTSGSDFLNNTYAQQFYNNILDVLSHPGYSQSDMRQTLSGATFNVDDSKIEANLHNGDIRNDAIKDTYGTYEQRTAYDEMSNLKTEIKATQSKIETEAVDTKYENMKFDEFAEGFEQAISSETEKIANILKKIDTSEGIKKAFGDMKVKIEDKPILQALNRIVKAQEDAARKASDGKGNDLLQKMLDELKKKK